MQRGGGAESISCITEVCLFPLRARQTVAAAAAEGPERGEARLGDEEEEKKRTKKIPHKTDRERAL